MEAGIIDGFLNGSFRPDDTLTRAQAVKMINATFERGALDGVSAPSFSDVPTDHWAFIVIP